MAEGRAAEFRICEVCGRTFRDRTSCPGCGGPLTLRDQTFLLGQTFGRYRIEAFRGMGGMGVVYEARHTSLERRVALKVMMPRLDDERYSARFLREAQVLARLKHPNIVEVYDFDTGAFGLPYFVMELVDGVNLRGLIGRQGPSPDLSAYADVLSGLGAALQYAHDRGVVHRDFKPENALISDEDGRRRTKVIDFGLVKLTDPEDEAGSLTSTGAIMGTLNYLAPEQIRGGELSPRTDQYQLALVVAELTTGVPARQGRTTGEILDVDIRRPISREALDRPGISEKLKEALVRATEPAPDRRFPSVEAFLEMVLPPPGTAIHPPLGRDEATTCVLETPSEAAKAAGRGPAEKGEATKVKRGAPVVSGSRKTAAPSRKRARLWFGVAAAVLVSAALATAFLLHRRHVSARSHGPVGHAGFALMKEMPAPPDARSVVTLDGDTVVLAGADCLYLWDRSGSQAPTRVPLTQGRRVAGALENGLVVLHEPGRIVLLNPLSGKHRVWADGVPPGHGVRLSPNGDFAAVETKGGVVVGRSEGGRFVQLGRTPVGRVQALDIDENYMALADGGSLSVFTLRPFGRLWRRRLDIGPAGAVAIQDENGLIAVGGWANKVLLFKVSDPGHPAALPVAGKTTSLRFLPDGPTLVAAGGEGLRLWRHDGGIVDRWDRAGQSVDSVWCSGEGFFTLDARDHMLGVFAYRDLRERRVVRLSPHAIWALAPAGGMLYAGSSDGALYAVDPGDGKVSRHALHLQGITSAVTDGHVLATASDDKTIALWKLPGLSVTWRSQAHEWLVNGLCLTGDPLSLWSASSDGTLKQWSWPRLEEQETLNLGKLTGKRLALQCVWVRKDQNLVLAGTWQHALAVLSRSPGGPWKASLLPFPAMVVYSLAYLPGVHAVLCTGVFGSNKSAVYDLDSGRLAPLPNPGLDLTWATALPGGDGAFAAGSGCVARLGFRRGTDGRIRYSVTCRLDTDMGDGYTTAVLPAGGEAVVGAGKGRLVFVPLSVFKGPPSYAGTLP